MQTVQEESCWLDSMMPYLHSGDLVVPAELGGRLAEVELVVEALGLLQVAVLTGGLVHPGGSPAQLVVVAAPRAEAKTFRAMKVGIGLLFV